MVLKEQVTRKEEELPQRTRRRVEETETAETGSGVE